MLPAPSGSIAQPLPRFEMPPSPSIGAPSLGIPQAVDRLRARSRSMAGVFALLALIAGLPLLFFTLPTEIVKLWPESASLYDWLGMPVNASGFRIEVTYQPEAGSAVPAIAIKGKIINETDREMSVPKVRLAVRDHAGKELYHWIVPADQDRLGPGGQGTFNARLESPPPDAADVEVRFAKAGE
jgi:hypothetical protein